MYLSTQSNRRRHGADVRDLRARLRDAPVGGIAAAIALSAALAAAPTSALATISGPVGPAPATVTGPYGTRLLAPAAATRCSAAGMTFSVAARWSRRALARPVRSIRVLLQRPGSEAVVAAVVFAPARPATTRRATLRSSQCLANVDLRYELFVGAIDVPHDHQSVIFRTHGVPVS